MISMDLTRLEEICEEFLKEFSETDAAHDLAHIKRVVANAKIILNTEPADSEIVIASAWLHDCVILPKNHPDRRKASQLAAQKSAELLSSTEFPDHKIDGVIHAIEAHSFSGGIIPKTIEAKVVQDADRLDALGAIGIARCFAVGGQLERAIYNPEDPFCESRIPNDQKWNVDHFYAKLFKLPDTMNTEGARNEANSRAEFMRSYLDQLKSEIQ